MNERGRAANHMARSAGDASPVCVRVREGENEGRGERRERGREPKGRRGAARHGGLNDDSKVDGFLGPFYIESQRSA